jgi:hypothetical protein
MCPPDAPGETSKSARASVAAAAPTKPAKAVKRIRFDRLRTRMCLSCEKMNGKNE